MADSNRPKHIADRSRRLALIAIFGAVTALAVSFKAEACTPLPNTLTNGATADATQVMGDFNGILACPIFSGNLGVGVTVANAPLTVDAPSTTTGAPVAGFSLTGAQSTANTSYYYGENISPTFTAASPNTLFAMIGLQSNPRNTSSGTISNFWGVNSVPQNTSTGAVSSFNGVDGAPNNTSSGAVTSEIGTLGQPQNTSSGTVGSMFGVMGRAINSGAGNGTYAVDKMYGFYGQCENTNAAGGVVNFCYELYLDTPVTTGTITNQYGVYEVAAGLTNYFAGNVGIGTNSPSSTLYVMGSAGGTQGWNQASDGRLKDDIATIPDALGLVERLRGVEFTWRPAGERPVGKTLKLPQGQQIGFIAQDVGKVVPEAVASPPPGSDGVYSMDYSKIVPILVEAVKEQEAEIKSQQVEINQLKAEVAASKR